MLCGKLPHAQILVSGNRGNHSLIFLLASACFPCPQIPQLSALLKPRLASETQSVFCLRGVSASVRLTGLCQYLFFISSLPFLTVPVLSS